MATRATYRFIPKGCAPVCFYIHYDGYPAGAAAYFHRALQSQRKEDDFGRRVGGRDITAAFVHANVELCEFAASHDAYGDTEYRYNYNVETDILEAQERYFVGSARNWRTIYRGGLHGFLNEPWEGSTVPKYYATPSMQWVNGQQRQVSRWFTVEQAQQDREAMSQALDAYRAKFPLNTGNINSMMEQLKRAEEVLEAVTLQAAHPVE